MIINDFLSCCFSNSLLMGSLHKLYFGCLRLLKSSDVEENLRPRALCRGGVMLCTSTSGDCISIYHICLLLPEVKMCFFSESLVSFRCHIIIIIIKIHGLKN